MIDRGKFIFRIWAGAMALLVTACAGSLPPVATDGFTPPVYRLSAGDRLNITVFGEEALSKEYIVTSEGDLAFPLLGDLPVLGKTGSELAADITKGLDAGYLNDPRVNVEVVNFRPFYVLGEVGKSGEYPYSTNLTVTQAIALASGFTYRAEQRRVYIRRAGSEQEMTYELTSDRPVYVRPGDTIRVGERYF